MLVSIIAKRINSKENRNDLQPSISQFSVLLSRTAESLWELSRSVVIFLAPHSLLGVELTVFRGR